MIVDALCVFGMRGLWSAATCRRFESADMSAHSKMGVAIGAPFRQSIRDELAARASPLAV